MNESFVGYLGLIVFLGGFVFIALKYSRNFRQLQKAYTECGLEWPTLTREQMLAGRTTEGLNKTFGSTFKVWGIILFSRPSDARIRIPLRKVRVTLLLFVLFPFLLGLILLIGLNFMENASFNYLKN
jgi:hypothetical protein